jgi:glycerophosphoryl diester phosphodiesterase
MAPPSPFRRSVTGRVGIVAHRGLSAVAPENTMGAFELAAEAGCDLVEFDVHLTSDDELVVIHDDTLDRTTNGTGLVRGHTLAEIRELDASHGNALYPGQRVPTLGEVVAWAVVAGVGLAPEIKQPWPDTGLPEYPLMAERVAEVLTAHDMVARSVVHAFEGPAIRRMRELLPDATTAVLCGKRNPADPLGQARGVDASGIHVWWEFVTPSLVRAAHEAGMHVHAWGTAEPPDAQTIARLVGAGVDSLSGNDPRPLRPILLELAALG